MRMPTCCIGDELPEENVLVAVKGVDEDVHEPADLSLELKLFCILSLFPGWGCSAFHV